MSGSLYKWLFDTHPTIGLSVMNSSLSVLGDFCAQFFFSPSGTTYDVARTTRFLIFGAFIAPLANMWNTYLEINYPLRITPAVPEPVPLESITIDSPKVLDSKLHRRTNSNVSSSGMNEPPLIPLPEIAAASPSSIPPINKFVLAKRLAVDQIFMAPISFIIFLVAMGLMEGKGPAAIWEKTANNLLSILLVNWQIWPLIQIVMFLYVPLKYRVPAAGVLGVMWTIYLSWQTASTRA